MKHTHVRHQVAGSARSLRSGSRLVGPSDPKQVIEVTVRVRSRSARPPAVERIGAQAPLKREPMGRAQFARQFGAAPADLSLVKAFARRSGLNVVAASAAERHVKVSGSIARMAAAFGVKLMEFEHADGAYRGRIGHVYVPHGLRDVVEGVFGLDSRRQARPHLVRASGSAASGPSPLTALQVADLYAFPPGLDGSGECIGLIEFGGGYRTSDLKKYFKGLGLAVPSVTAVGIDGATNKPGANPDEDGEVALDIEVAGAVAPAAKLVVYFAPFTEQGWVDSLTRAVHDSVNKPSVISISWGFAEGDPIQGFEWTPQTVQAVNQALQAAAAMGVTVCVAAGDDGSNDQVGDGHAHVDFPASSPYALGCGGTRLTAASGKVASETVWNDGPGSGGGGGISDMNPLPDWQKGIVPVSVNPAHNSGRGVPDVTGNADPDTGYPTVCAGKTVVVGGTSAVAPLWAGLLARINQKLGKPVGYLNPLLYAKVGASPAFTDIVSGNNDTTGKVGGYAAGPGWDAASGWGSPVGSALLTALGS